MDISIVIPVLNESKKIAADINSAAGFLKDNHFGAEIIVVDDGSYDNTAETAKQAAAALPPEIEFKLLRSEKHLGKGHAVTTGIKQSRGEYVMFVDSGNCVPYEDALKGLELLKSGNCDIAHGSRKMPTSQIKTTQSLYRRICSKIFHWFTIWYMKIPAELTDTQCGFKLYKGDPARKLYGECITDGFMFDIEIVLRALLGGFRIKEFPITWSCDRDSRLSPTRNAERVFLELVKIKRTLSKK